MKGKSLYIDDKLELRLPEENFAEEIFTIVDAQREYLREWLPWVDHTRKMENTRTFLKESRLFNSGGQKLSTFIFYKNKVAGSIGLVRIDKEHRLAEIGYWLREDLQGKGIMTKSCQRLIDYVYKNMNLNRIEIRTIIANKKSAAIPRRLGFLLEGELEQCYFMYGSFYDINLFSMTKKRWEMRDKK